MSDTKGDDYGFVHDFGDIPNSSSRFKFKSKRRPAEDDVDEHASDRHRRKRRKSEDESHPQEGRKHRRRRRHREPSITSTSASPGPAPPTTDRSPSPLHHMDRETAFRESLFDAMADEEGADYWASVYGQPIHNYPNTYVSKETGKLESMNEDEYAEYVRTKMWEKSHQHIVEERARREAAAKKAKEEREAARKSGSRMEADQDAFRRRMEESLRKGEERRAEKGWKDAWRRYLDKWEEVMKQRSQLEEAADLDKIIPWPTVSGNAKDIDASHITAFFEHMPKELREKGLKDVLKKERIRWHPDKMQQRLGRGLREQTLQTVTATFQLIDDLWSKT